MMIHRSIPILLTLLFGSAPARADDAEIARLLQEKGIKVTETKGAVTAVEAGDCSPWTVEDFKRLAQLARLKRLSFGPELGDSSLALLSGLSELEYLSTNLSLISDDGMKGFATFKGLKTLKGIDLPEAEVDRLREELPKVEIKWTKPNEVSMKRIQALFGTP
jgi:hypothetical protein